MKLFLTYATALLTGVLIISCKTELATAQLEELPKDIAASLQRLPNSNFLVSVPPATTIRTAVKNRNPTDPVLPLPACNTTFRYFVQVFDPAPITYCSPAIADLDAITAYDTAMNTGSRPPPNRKRYKLSYFQGKALPAVILCEFRNGPWLATILKNVDCFSNESCTLTIAVPWSPVYEWRGDHCESQNRPPELQIIDQIVDGGISSSVGCNSQTVCQ